MVKTVNQKSKESFSKKQNIRGNQHTSSGKYGARTSKSDGTEFEEKKWKTRVTGKPKIEEAIDIILKRNDVLVQLVDEKEKE